MNIDTVLIGVMENLFSDIGAAATYAPATGDAVSCQVLVDKGVQAQPGGFEARTWSQGVTLEYLLSEVGVEANRGETFTVGSTVYRVASVSENDGIVVKCEVKEV